MPSFNGLRPPILGITVIRRVAATSMFKSSLLLPSMASRPSFGPGRRTSPRSSWTGSPRRSTRTRPMRRSTSPGAARKTSEPPTGPRTQPRAAYGRRRSSLPSPPARSPRSPASAGRYGNGATRSWPTSPPAGPTTAVPKPSMESSSCTAASPAATATARTTGSECCWPQEHSPLDPHRIGEEPVSHAASARSSMTVTETTSWLTWWTICRKQRVSTWWAMSTSPAVTSWPGAQRGG